MGRRLIQINVFCRLKSRVAAFVHSQPRIPGSLDRTWERGVVHGLFAALETRRKLGRVNFRKDFWDCC